MSQRVSALGSLAGTNVTSVDFRHVFCVDVPLLLQVGKTAEPLESLVFSES